MKQHTECNRWRIQCKEADSGRKDMALYLLDPDGNADKFAGIQHVDANLDDEDKRIADEEFPVDPDRKYNPSGAACTIM